VDSGWITGSCFIAGSKRVMKLKMKNENENAAD
jgi:hypothetical protein